MKEHQRRRQMHFIRNIDHAQVEGAASETVEYQVLADAHIVGELNYGPYDFMPWEFTALDQAGRQRWLCLRVRYVEGPDDNLPAEQRARRRGYYHDGGVPGEIVTLAALFLRRRLQLGMVVRRNDRPMMYSERFRSPQSWIDRTLVSGQGNLGDLHAWFQLVEHLKPELHQPFILAARLYQQALDAIETQPDIAYLNLISAIEVLCRSFPIPSPPLEEINAELARVIDEVPDAALRQRLRQAAITRERFINRRFVAIILAHVEPSFWEEERPAQGAIEPMELPELLRRIYDQRSATLHQGEPFPPYILEPPFEGEEQPVFLGMSSGERTWAGRDLLPYPHFFERLVRHVLLNYLRRNQTD